MNRDIIAELGTWLQASRRLPLVLRGARQVGKTWVVRELARRAGRALLELNFERDVGLARLLGSNDPRAMLGEISLRLGVDAHPDRSLLFLDEVQETPSVLAKLRWFAEELPSMPVIAAGSLLEFALSDAGFSMPVGRVSFRHLEPMSFPEYLQAHRQGRLRKTLEGWQPGQSLSATAHQQSEAWFRRYAMVGGMPAVVAEDVMRADPRVCRAVQRNLIATYRADFAKYAGRMERGILEAVLQAVAGSVGRKFVYARAGEGVKQHQAKRALELMAHARVCHLVRHTDANGLPLGAQVRDAFRKAILLDVGLLHALLGTPAQDAFPAWEQLAPSVRGQVADQVVGQQLRLLDEGTGDGAELFYWQREGGRPGEIDYVVQAAGRILPVEVKSGAAGAMKSLHQFMHDKKLELAVRVDANPPTDAQVSVRTTQGQQTTYRLVSVPPYLVWALGRWSIATSAPSG